MSILKTANSKNNKLFIVMIFTTAILMITSIPIRSVSAWQLATHGYLATKCLDLDNKSVADYIARTNVKLGSIVPDFFWFLSSLIGGEDVAESIHGYTFGDENQNPELLDPETPLYKHASDKLRQQAFGLKYFTEGIKTHVFADIKIHHKNDGFLEGKANDAWINALSEKIKAVDNKDYNRMALHVALECAIDSLVIDKYGPQLSNLRLNSQQARFLERVVNEIPGFDVEPEFAKYLINHEFNVYVALARKLEKVERNYIFLLKYNIFNEAFLDSIDSGELLNLIQRLGICDALDHEYNDPLSFQQSASWVEEIIPILVSYPSQIFEILTADGVINWEDALQKVIDEYQLQNPIINKEHRRIFIPEKGRDRFVY